MGRRWTSQRTRGSGPGYRDVLYRCALLLLGVAPALSDDAGVGGVTVSLSAVTAGAHDRRPKRVRSAGAGVQPSAFPIFTQFCRFWEVVSAT